MVSGRQRGGARIGHQVSIGGRLRALREFRSLSQQDVAERIGHPKAQIGQWERGERNPGIDPLRTLADAMDASLAWLALGLGDPFDADAPNGPLVEACVRVAINAGDALDAPARAARLISSAMASGLALRRDVGETLDAEVRLLAERTGIIAITASSGQ